MKSLLCEHTVSILKLMNLNALEDFVLVASHGSLGRASRASGRSKATLSRRITNLEDALSVRLLERGASRLTLTESGQLLLARSGDSLRDIAETLTAVSEGSTRPQGLLRVAAPLLFSQLAFGELSAKFLTAYPGVQLEVVSEDRVVDLVEEHFDAVIRTNPHVDSMLVGRCFAKDRLVVAAVPSIGKPAADGAGKPVPMPAIVLTSYGRRPWVLEDSRLVIDPQPVLCASSLLVVRDAALAGAGVALLPQSLIGPMLSSGELVQWGTTTGTTELWVLHTSHRLPSPKVRAFVDFMAAQYLDGQLVFPRRV